ncbi:hypothetical protein ABND55_15035, partial [Paenibacillus larvae]
EGYEYGSFHFLEPSFLHNYTDSTPVMYSHPGREYKLITAKRYLHLFSSSSLQYKRLYSKHSG